MLSERQLNELRKKLGEYLTNYYGIEKIKIDGKVLEKVIFKYEEDEHQNKYKSFALYKKLIQKLDLSNVSFDDFKASGFNFSDLYGVCINPQKIYEKKLMNTICNGVKFIGPFEDANINYTDFTGSTGAIINPQKIWNKSLIGTVCNEVKFIGPFDDCDIMKADFTGSTGAIINPQKIYDKTLCDTICNGVTFIGPFVGCDIDFTNFTGSTGAIIDCQKIKTEYLKTAILNDVTFVEDNEYNEYLEEINKGFQKVLKK